jgi:HSP90 family molecular chaperone
LLQAEEDAAPIEDPDVQALPEWRGQHADAEVELLVGHLESNLPILGQAPLRDVQLGHDFYAADQSRFQLFRRRLHIVEDSVDAIPNSESVLKGLKVNITRPHLNRSRDNQVYQSNDRALGGHVAEMINILLILGLNFRGTFNIFNNLLHGGSTCAVEPFKGFQDICLFSQKDPDVALGGQPDGIDGVETTNRYK